MILRAGQSELVHIAKRDAAWNLLNQVLSRTFPFQPLNWLAGHQLRKEMDFVADSTAAQTLGERTGLATYLLRLGDRLTHWRGERRCGFGPCRLHGVVPFDTGTAN